MPSKNAAEAHTSTLKYQTVIDGETSTSESTGTYVWLNAFYGDPNPHYKQDIASGISATTNASGTYTKIEDSRGSFAVRLEVYSKAQARTFHTYQFAIYGTVQPALPRTDGAASAEAENIARSQFYSKARSAMSAIMAGQDLGEYKETVKGIRNRGTQLFKQFPAYIDSLIRDLEGAKGYLRKHPRKRRRLELDKLIANTYLEYNFGWRPLIEDIKGAVNGIVDSSPLINSKRFAGQGQGESVAPLIYDSVLTNSSLVVGLTTRYDSVVQVRYKGAVSIAHERGARIRENLGLTLDNFIPTVYELIPYSFVVDYFSNLGDIINALSFCKARVNWVNRTVRVKATCSAKTGQILLPPTQEDISFIYTFYEEQNGPMDLKITTADWARTAPANVPIPSFEVKFPSSSKVWTNLGALLAARTGVASKLIGAILE
jgi:hypothetical protein